MDAQPDPMHDLATRIYVELVGRNTRIEEDGVKMAASASSIAVLSLKLSEAFCEAEAKAKAAKEPVKDYKLGLDDLAGWAKK